MEAILNSEPSCADRLAPPQRLGVCPIYQVNIRAGRKALGSWGRPSPFKALGRLEEPITLSPNMAAKLMPFAHLANPYTRIILTDVFQEYCHKNDIGLTSPEYQGARELVLTLFHNGHRTVPHLKAALVAAIDRVR